MTARDLIALLEDVDPDAEVRLAMQPSWPLEYAISDVCALDAGPPEIVHDDVDGTGVAWWIVRDEQEGDVDGPFASHEDAEEALSDGGGDEDVVVYLCEGTQLGYLPGAFAKSIGWR